jgi:hypothetical protein
VSATAEIAAGIRLSDPKPGHCAACFRGAQEDIRFVDFDAAVDRGGFQDPDSLALMDSIDDLHLCEACVRSGAEALGLKPELHTRQLKEIRRLELEAEHWHAYAKRLERTLEDRPKTQPKTTRKRRAA